MTKLFNKKTDVKKPRLLKLYIFKSLKDLKYNMFENKEELIKLVISRTNPNLIRYNKKKVFFIHPFFNRYGCDINADIFDLVPLNQPRIYAFQNIITIDVELNNETVHPIKYEYTKFISEALKLHKSDILEYNFKNDYEEAIHIEEYEASTQNEEYNNIKKYNQNIYDILNHKKMMTVLIMILMILILMILMMTVLLIIPMMN